MTDTTTTPAVATTSAAPDSSAPADGFGSDRRKRNIPVATDRRRAANAAEKRKKSERRRLIDPTTCERDYTDHETDFMKAMDRYKRDNRRPFPTWSEVLEVLHSMGYRKVAEATDLPGAKRTSTGELIPDCEGGGVAVGCRDEFGSSGCATLRSDPV